MKKNKNLNVKKGINRGNRQQRAPPKCKHDDGKRHY